MTPKEELDYLKNRISKLELNHKIGNRNIANLEIKDVVMGIETHVIPSLENALTELEELKATVKELLDMPIMLSIGRSGGKKHFIDTANKLKRLVGAKDE